MEPETFSLGMVNGGSWLWNQGHYCQMIFCLLLLNLKERVELKFTKNAKHKNHIKFVLLK